MVETPAPVEAKAVAVTITATTLRLADLNAIAIATTSSMLESMSMITLRAVSDGHLLPEAPSWVEMEGGVGCGAVI